MAAILFRERLFKKLKFCFTGDLGGYLGLLVGASVITVFELLDLLLYNRVIKLRKKCSSKKKVAQTRNHDIRL